MLAPMDCPVCAENGGLHELACPVRLPGWALPPRIAARFGGPVLLDEVLRPPSAPPGLCQADRRALAARLRAEGLLWREIGVRLGCSESQAWQLGHAKRSEPA